MDIGPLKILKDRDAYSVKITVVTAAFFVALLIIGGAYDLFHQIHTSIGLPIEYRSRQFLAVPPKLSDQLKIISLDDSTYAYTKKPNLTGDDWSHLLETVGAAEPSAIVTTHMFGTGEFIDAHDRLSHTIRDLKNQGTQVITGSFAYPLRISFRKPLPLTRSEFQVTSIDKKVPTADLPGWAVYGPEAQFAHNFSAIGHLGYDGKARIPAYIKVSETHLIPHISLVTPGTVKTEHIDNKGRLLINPPDMTQLIKISKSMKFLMTDGDNWAKKVIQKGDVVLLLSEMYTGKVNFVETPIGSIPSGYVVASAVNSALTGQWLKDRSNAIYVVAIFLCLGLTCGLAPNFVWFGSSFLVGITVIPVIGILSFCVNGTIMPWVSSTFFFAGSASFVFLRRTQERLASEKARNSKIEKEKDKLNAIVRTAQMFAHDVRKPFSMLNMTAQSVQKISDPEKIRSLMTRMLPELERAMSSVEGMIQDIMEIDARSTVHREQTDVKSFIDECLRDGFRLRNAKDISLSYDLNHSMNVEIDRLRIKRVILNIVDNAIQAMGTSGRMWIASNDMSDSGKSFVELTIGNANTYIDQENIERIFEAFYTSGKKGGTGLGLAIAQKVVLEHGGKISARSKKDLGTEFTFSLPVSHSVPVYDQGIGDLPIHSSAYCEFKLPEFGSLTANTKESEALLIRLVETKKSLNRPIKILVVDDEQVYLETIQTILTNGSFADLFDVSVTDNSKNALSFAQFNRPDVILCDIDLGSNSSNGFELVANIRERGNQSFIIMHSNRTSPLDAEKANSAGADAFLPKPIDEIKFIATITKGLNLPVERTMNTKNDYKDIVVVIDDDVFVLEAWATILDDAELMTFESPTHFWQYLAANKSFINDIKLIVTDFYFDNESHENGESFAVKIKTIGDIPVLLSSNASFSTMPSVFDGMIGKEPATYQAINRKLKKIA
jgi:signal transduction histidine kinase/CheY-like chemotaxis protein